MSLLPFGLGVLILSIFWTITLCQRLFGKPWNPQELQCETSRSLEALYPVWVYKCNLSRPHPGSNG